MTTHDIFTAARKGDVEKIRSLIKGGADVNQADNTGRTVLVDAAFRGHPKIVKLLLENMEQTQIRQPKTAGRL